ncbi:expressed unknown protein [Seminavis robusta]|uniref:Uncharacterized protein n=1 Tax=Seminavis robusta TaxID=568900 RepID=A0A9N8E477_9STRA|nr:expressed unknown protein [Seminavis robusta]|eukprot:Sro647_g180840.1 n/a (289) ;mRNA; r:5827-6693
MSPPPPKKAKGDTNDATTTLAAAPPNGAASSATADVAGLLVALENPEVIASLGKKLGKKFVSREEHEELKARLDKIAGVFEPSTQFALFETAIYEFVRSDIEKLFSAEEEQEKAKHALAVLCDDIVKQLVVDPATKKGFSFVGFSSRRRRNEKVTRKEWKPSVLRALHGLAAYIEIEQESTLKKWATNSGQRNLVTHDGAFVDALYLTADGKTKASVFTETKEKVKKHRRILKEKSREDPSCATLDGALEDIVKALVSKKVEVGEAAKASVVHELKRLVGDTVAKRED